jgi:aldehyde:ferredoxin oxidoreductase
MPARKPCRTPMDSLILCKFLRGVFDDKLAAFSEMLRLVTGWETTPAELEAKAGRIVTLKKVYNIRQGWTPEEDTLPDRFFSEELPSGPGQGTRLSRAWLARMVAAYNTARGWNAAGYPPQERTIVASD